MSNQTKVMAGLLLLVVSAVLLFWTVSGTSTTVILAVAAIAALGLAAGSLLVGSTGTDGRMV